MSPAELPKIVTRKRARIFYDSSAWKDCAITHRQEGGRLRWDESTGGNQQPVVNSPGIICIYTRARQNDIFHVVIPLLSLLRSHRTFPRTRIIRRKRLRDLNLDARITSEWERDPPIARVPGRNPTSTSLIPSCDPPIDRFVARECWQGATDARRRMFNMYTHFCPQATRARGFPAPSQQRRRILGGDLKLFAQAHSPSAGRSDATIPLPRYEPLVNN